MFHILEPDFAAKLGDHITRDCETEASTTTLGFGRKKRFKDLFTDLLGYPRARILDPDFGPLGALFNRKDHVAIGR